MAFSDSQALNMAPTWLFLAVFPHMLFMCIYALSTSSLTVFAGFDYLVSKSWFKAPCALDPKLLTIWIS